MSITVFVCMTFYRVNDCFVLRRNVNVLRLLEGEPYPTHISSKLLAYGTRAKSHSMRFLALARSRGSEN